MLHLKRVQYFNEFLRWDVSGEVIGYEDYYYEDDEDGLIVKATVYKELERRKKEAEFDYAKLQAAESQRDYQEKLRQYEKEFLAKTLLDRKVFNEGVY